MSNQNPYMYPNMPNMGQPNQNVSQQQSPYSIQGQGYPQNIQGQPQYQYPTQQYPQNMNMVPQQGYPQMGYGPMPSFNMPDAQQMMTSYQEHKMSMGKGGSLFNFVKFLGPNGESKWESMTVPIGYQSVIRVYILPPWAPGKYIFAISNSHFWKSVGKPQGASIGCLGPERCRVCQTARLAIESSDPNTQKRAKDWGSVNTNYLYQVALLDNPQAHFNSGNPQPFVLRAGATLHKAIGNLFEARSINICNPELGRPVQIKKTKTGPGKFDVEYSCIDEDPQPLPQHLWGLLSNLVDLDSVFKEPTQEEMISAISDMGLGNSNPNPGYNQTIGPQYTVPPMQAPIPQNMNPIPQIPNLIPQGMPQNQNLNPPPVISSPYTGPQYQPQPSQPMQPPIPQNVNPVSQVNRTPMQQVQSQPSYPIPQGQNPIPGQNPQVVSPNPNIVQQQPMTLQQLQEKINGTRQ